MLILEVLAEKGELRFTRLSELVDFRQADFSLLIGQLPRSAFLDRFRLAGQPALVNEWSRLLGFPKVGFRPLDPSL